jgi:gluconate 2-dehydrogenase gamma chain
MGTERSAFHPGPGGSSSNQGRIHSRRPNRHSHFSLAAKRRTIHSGLLTILEVLRFAKINQMTGPHLSRRELLLYSSMATLPWAGGARSAGAISSHAHERASSPSHSGKLQFFTEEDAADVESITALILPTDETPGAREAGVIHFIDRALATFDREKQAIYRAGLAEVRQHIQRLAPGLLRVAQLSPEQQAELMEAIVPSEFFGVIRTHTLMGFFGNPSYGGNRGEVGWKLIQFEDQFTFRPPFGHYDADPDKA